MRRQFTQEFKVQAVEKALSQCDDVRLEDIADDLGVGYSTLQRWIALAKKHQLEIHQTGSQMTAEKRPQDWSLEERLNAVIECGSLDEAAINEYCRNIGAYSGDGEHRFRFYREHLNSTHWVHDIFNLSVHDGQF